MANKRQLSDVKFYYFRYPITEQHLGEEVVVGKAAQGGAVLAYVERDGQLFAAASYCHPNDNFNFNTGRNKAEGRLVQLLEDVDRADFDKYFFGMLADYDDNTSHWLKQLRNHFNELGYI